MMNENISLFQNPEIQQKMLILAGHKIEPAKELSAEIKKQIQKDYTAMFYSIAAINWCRGGTLGMAWQKGLEQMNSFVLTKMQQPNNPVGKYLSQFHNEFKKDMAKDIMTGQHSGDKLELAPEFIKDWIEYATNKFKEKMSHLNGLYKQYVSDKQVDNAKTKSFENGKQNAMNLMQQMLIQQMLRGRAA